MTPQFPQTLGKKKGWENGTSTYFGFLENSHNTSSHGAGTYQIYEAFWNFEFSHHYYGMAKSSNGVVP